MVDDPCVFGQVAAANALSDIYGMEGSPVVIMNPLCFTSCFDTAVMQRDAEIYLQRMPNARRIGMVEKFAEGAIWVEVR